jgi:NitT/TauT family transport system permease protein
MNNLFKPIATISDTNKLFVMCAWAAFTIIAWFTVSITFVPTPIEVFQSWLFLIKQESLLVELYVSIVTNIQALAITTILSLLISYIVVLPFMYPFVVFCSKARFFGITGFVVFFTLMFGGGHWLKVALLVFGMSVFFITSMSSVIVDTPREEFDYARTLRFSNWQIVWEVIILGKFDQALEILRQNAAMGWVMLTMVEGLNRSEGGLGALMLNESKHFKLAAVFAIQFTVLAIGILQDFSLKQIRSWLCPYAELNLEANK